jgi:nascent polypeptide-associated complex subunit alpha
MTDVNPVPVATQAAPAPAVEAKQAAPKKAAAKQAKATPAKGKQAPAKAQPKAGQPKSAAKSQPKATQPKNAQPKAQQQKGAQPKAQPAKSAETKAPAQPAKAPQPKAPKAKQAEKKKEEAKVEKPKAEPKPVVDDDKVKVEEIQEGVHSDDDDERIPPLESDAASAGGKLNKNEKKARKAIAKLGLKPVTGVNRVTVKKAQDILFIIAKPEIFKTPGSDTYVIFGEAKIENLSNNQLATKVKEVIENRDGAGVESAPEATQDVAPVVAEPQAVKVEEVKDDEPVDESGINATDIELLMTQSNVSRARAVKALKATNGDIVNAIMQLTNAE